MQRPQNFYNLLFVIVDLSSTIIKKIEDYENLIYKKELVKDFYNIEFVYMHSILLDMAKLLSVTKSDKSGLVQLKENSPPEIKKEIIQFEEAHKDIITKITNNRNRIISHVDIGNRNSYFDMGISDREFRKNVADYVEYLSVYGKVDQDEVKAFQDSFEKIKSTSVDNEKYSLSDFVADLDILKTMAGKIRKLSYEVNVYHYESNS